MTAGNSQFYSDLLKTFTPEVPGATIYAEAFNAVADEVEGVQTVLGTGLRARSLVSYAPNTTTWGTLAARLDNVDAGVRSTSPDVHPQYALKSGTYLQPTDAGITPLTVQEMVGSIATAILRVQASDATPVLEASRLEVAVRRPLTVSQGATVFATADSAALTLHSDNGYTGTVLSVFSDDDEVAGLDAFGFLQVQGVETDVLTVTGTFEGAQHDHSSPEQGGRVLPAGMIVPFAGTTLPNGWLAADGSTVGRTAFPDLFSAIGTAYGVGDGSTSFALPDLRERFVMGASAGTTNTQGVSGGTFSHTLLATNIPSHQHTMDHGHGTTLTSVEDTAHTHRLTGTGNVLIHQDGGTAVGSSGAQVEALSAADPGALTGTPTESHAHTVTIPAFTGSTGLVGSGNPVSHTPPFLALNYIIKT